jgi:hypothetical protein
VEITEDLDEDGQIPPLEIDYEGSVFYGLTVIEYQGAIIDWLQREYGEDMDVEYTLYEEYLAARLNIKRYLINYPFLSDYGQKIFCLSFPSRDRATAPGQCE